MSSEENFGILTHDDPHYTAVGRIASTWAFLEALIDTEITNLMRADGPAVACLTAQYIGPAPRLNALVSLVRLRNGSAELVDDLNKFSGRAQGLGTKRNRIVHDPLFVEQNSGKVYAARTTAKGALEHAFVPISLAEMNGLHTQIDNAINEWIVLADRISAEMSAQS